MPSILQRFKRRMQHCTSRVFCNRTNLAVESASTSEDKDISENTLFSSSNLALRIQKKVASKLSNRNIAKLVLTDAASRVFDNFYNILKERYSKKNAEKVCKNMIKIVVKLGLVSRSDILSPEEQKLLPIVQRKIHYLALTTISFQQVAFSYDRIYFIEQLSNLKYSLLLLVKHNLSGKSAKRVEHIFEHISDPQILDDLFKVNGPHAKILEEIVKDLEQLLEEKDV